MYKEAFGQNELPKNEKEYPKQFSLGNQFASEQLKSEPLEIREQKLQEQIANLENKNSELGFAPLSEKTKRMIRENTVGNDESNKEKSSENTSRERELKRELKENDLILPEGRDIENAEKMLKENGVPYEVEKYMKGVDGESGRVPAEFVLVINDPQNTNKPASFDFVKKVFQFLQDNEIVVRYAKNPEKAGAEM